MFKATPDQEYLLSVLDATKVMRKGQALRLLFNLGEGRTEAYARHCLLQLGHMRKIAWKTDDVFATPMMFNEPVDEDMLSAVDVMLDLTGTKAVSVAAGPAPFKLRFLSDRGNASKGFAIVVFNVDSERGINDGLPAAPGGCAIIFLLSYMTQKNRVKTSLPHYFAIHDGGRYRYFRKG